MKVCSTQFNYRHGKRMHFPFSIAMLTAYLKNNKKIKDNFHFEKSFIFRDQIEKYLEDSKDCDILLCSCYAWNWEITIQMAKLIKEKNPSCLIIFGGPQVPNRSEGFFVKYPFIDLLVHGEGELVISNVFLEFLNKKDFSQIKGIETVEIRTDPEKRIDEDSLPSPYLTNIIWELVDRQESEKWATNWETNRGCPYGCTFCDWGAAAFNKTTRYAEDRLFNEIKWFAENKLEFIECCDANFGMFHDRDLKIAECLKQSAIKTGYPKYFSSAWAKASSDKIIPIAKKLQEGGLLRDVTLALQSMDEETLKIVKRANIKFDKYSQLTQAFLENGITAYTEIIRGLPGESLNTFKRGLEVVAEDGKISTMYIHTCAIYVNAPMNEPAYKEFHKIKTKRSPMYTSHVIIPKNDIQEYEEIVISTSSFTHEELKQMHLFSWMTLTFQIFGILEMISKFYNITYGLGFIEFYDKFIKYCEQEDSEFSKEFRIFTDYIEKGYSGKGWNHLDSSLGEIVWPIEEASWLRLTRNKENLKNELKKYVNFLEKEFDHNTSLEKLDELIEFQLFVITTRNEPQIKIQEFQFDWKNFFISKILTKNHSKYSYQNKVKEDDPILWGYYAIWYGRGTQQFKIFPEHLIDNKEDLQIKIKQTNQLSP